MQVHQAGATYLDARFNDREDDFYTWILCSTPLLRSSVLIRSSADRRGTGGAEGAKERINTERAEERRRAELVL